MDVGTAPVVQALLHRAGAVHRSPDATDLAWIDASAFGLDDVTTLLRERAGVTVTDGALCGAGSEGHVRLVVAMSRPILEEAIAAMGAALATR